MRFNFVGYGQKDGHPSPAAKVPTDGHSRPPAPSVSISFVGHQNDPNMKPGWFILDQKGALGNSKLDTPETGQSPEYSNLES